jgi:hypothetical protein
LYYELVFFGCTKNSDRGAGCKKLQRNNKKNRKKARNTEKGREQIAHLQQKVLAERRLSKCETSKFLTSQMGPKGHRRDLNGARNLKRRLLSSQSHEPQRDFNLYTLLGAIRFNKAAEFQTVIEYQLIIQSEVKCILL